MTDEPPDRHATYLEYIGIAGATKECVEAVERLLLTGGDVRSALILTSHHHAHPDHALLLSVGEGDLMAVKCGFTSGYGGAGPKGFSAILYLLDWHAASIEEILVDAELLERLDASALTTDDLETIKAARRVRPQRLWDYIVQNDDRRGALNPWRHSDLQVPMAIIDDRLAVAARDFWHDPDGLLLKAHRQLEELIRKKAGISVEEATGGPAATYRLAFNGEHPRITWPDISNSEHVGRINIFMGALNAYRHVRAHRSDKGDKASQLRELLLLNHLFELESEAIARRCDDAT